MSQEESFGHKKEYSSTRRNFLSQEGISYHRVMHFKKFKMREFHIRCCGTFQYFVGDFIPISPGISHPGQYCPSQMPWLHFPYQILSRVRADSCGAYNIK
eukprot:GFUD01076527.1.p1 GENE.GFUD01076527.1~~GFUD01076527.1.p1  ORF type:complete len:100 (-),score=4.50 GFUD01076527.1:27-326(-)